MIETLISCWLSVADPSAAPICVRDNAASLPDTGAFADESDTLFHAVSRTLFFPRPVAILPPVRVDAALDRARLRAPTAFVTTLRLGDDSRALVSLSEVLIEAAGVQLTQYGGMGSFSTMSLRGAPPGHVTVLLDGVPLTSAARGVVDLAGLPATAIAAIEVYRGAAPASLGTPTPGGAVNLITSAASAAREMRVASGSYGTGEAQASWGARRGAWALLAHGGWQGSNSDFPYADDNGTPLEPSDDRLTPRVNARFDAVSALVRGSYARSDRLRAAAHVEYFRRGQGVPGPGATPALGAHFASERLLLASEVHAGRGAAWPALELRANTARERSRLRDTAGELGYGRVDTHERFGDAAGSLALTSPARWRTLALGAGAAVRAEDAHPAAPTAGLAAPPPSERDTRGAWLTADLRFAADRVLLHAARRWDRQDEHVRDTRSTGVLRVRDAARTLDAPQLGARVRLGRGLEARGNWSRSGRSPEFDELFGIDGSVTGNPTLRPEHAENWDAGLAWEHAMGPLRVSAEWSHHASHVRDMVLFERSSPRGARPVNVGAARLFGEESALRAAWRGAELSASTAWLSATDRSAISFYHGRRLPQRSERQSFARLAWHGRSWTAASQTEYLSDTFLDRANFRRAPSRTLIGASLGRRVGRLLALAEGRNLADRRAEDVAGFPLPGRMFLFSLSLDLGEHVAHP
jgi:iron complex outermembrane receptor protein